MRLFPVVRISELLGSNSMMSSEVSGAGEIVVAGPDGGGRRDNDGQMLVEEAGKVLLVLRLQGRLGR